MEKTIFPIFGTSSLRVCIRFIIAELLPGTVKLSVRLPLTSPLMWAGVSTGLVTLLIEVPASPRTRGKDILIIHLICLFRIVLC